MYENCLEDDAENRLANLFMQMLQRGFRDQTIIDAIEMAVAIPRP
jgi:hypothetical protein